MSFSLKLKGRDLTVLGRVVRSLDRFSRHAKVAVLLTFDLILLTLVVFAAYAIRFGGDISPTTYQILLLLAAPPITCACLFALRTYGNVARLHASGIEGAYAFAIGISALLWSLLILALGADGFPRSLVILYGGLSIIAYIATRRSIAVLFRLGHARLATDLDNVAIFGVNHFGLSLVQTLRMNGQSRPVAFIDTDPANIGRKVDRLPVVALADVHKAIDDLDIDSIILALEQRSRQRERELLNELGQRPVKVLTIAPPEDIISGRVSISDIRTINIEDVLGRDPIQPMRELMARPITGKRVMVTGAGGSIGSELVRQAVRLEPASLVLFELSEVALYQVDREVRTLLEQLGVSIEVTPVLGSVCDKALVDRTLAAGKIEVILHAAAYKHVPLGERNALSCVANNSLGTKVLADSAMEANVELFVLISTDKAVRPTNIMGASKRVAELVLQDKAAQKPSTIFTMVRFGNVLGSSGSVIPLFRSQIETGGPVTVTDPRMVRYFMTIPEAVELVLQAAGMASGGEVFVLDMGEPVKIDTLARTLISLSNLTVRDAANPDGDIEIVYTGIRAGEKMYEELLIGTNVVTTAHPRIMRCLESALPHESLAALLADLAQSASDGDEARLRVRIRESVEGFSDDASGNPTGGVEIPSMLV